MYRLEPVQEQLGKAAAVGRRLRLSDGRGVDQVTVQAPAVRDMQWEEIVMMGRVVYEGDRSRRHRMIFFLLSPFLSLLRWSIPSRDIRIIEKFARKHLWYTGEPV
jgi:hypothetical protein